MYAPLAAFAGRAEPYPWIGNNRSLRVKTRSLGRECGSARVLVLEMARILLDTRLCPSPGRLSE